MSRFIDMISKQISEEVHDAECYAKEAVHTKPDNKELAELYAVLSGEELKHVDMLHSQIVKEIEAKRKTGVKPPEHMMELWEERHKQIIEKTAHVRYMLEMYKK